MKFLLIYYTGTYNTRYLTKCLASRLSGGGHSVTCVEINRDTPTADLCGYDFVGFGYPVYAFNTPKPFDKYFKKLRFEKGQKYFIYKNSGETYKLNNASSRKIWRGAKRKGGVFAGEYHFVMPYNIHFPFEKRFIAYALAENAKLLEILYNDIAVGTVKQIKPNFKANVVSRVLAVQKIGGAVNSFFYRIDKKLCVNCNLCVKNCPQNNVYVKNGKIKFAHRCQMCMRCSFYCPKNAIKIGFLQKWRVNGDYRLNEISADGEQYISNDGKGFYRCFKPYFDDIDAEYARLIADK